MTEGWKQFQMKKINEILKSFLKQYENEPSFSYYPYLHSLSDLIDEPYHSFTEAQAIKDKTLIIGVTQPSVLVLLQMEKDKILHKVNKAFPELTITDIKWVPIKSKKPVKTIIQSTENQQPTGLNQNKTATEAEFSALLETLKTLGKKGE